MNIDYSKLVQLLLPTFLRKSVLIELLRTLIGPLQIMHSQANLWFDDARYKANTNASVISLIHLIEREFDVLATIEELDGQPTDFKVTVSGTVDEVRLRALLNQYKIAGRSFTFRIGSVVYSSSFINHVCEDIIAVYSVEFIDYVCEESGYIYLSFGIGTRDITVNASRPVTSEISISGFIRGRMPSGVTYNATSFGVTILEGESMGTGDIILDPVSGEYYFVQESSVDIIPNSDTYFTYIIEKSV